MLRYDRQIKPGLVALDNIVQETERVYSYNPEPARGARSQNVFQRTNGNCSCDFFTV